eukprot:TRINITY_DN5429_c0_g1_i1.p1 TRINITY_DN5429_c0_g1~~TRINITY_DN5429_c0_g1_i1.p1  ORF type:complete len:123 (+),score=39.60 TRINITY_DN5429_c0_g1_i1:203-571(+)
MESMKSNEEVYHLLYCEKCQQIIGKHYTISGEYKSKYCFARSSMEIVSDLSSNSNIEETKEQIVEIRKKRMELDGNILKMMKKVLRKITKAKMLIQGYSEQSEYISESIDYLRENVLKIDGK